MNETTTTPSETTAVAAPSRRRARGWAATLVGVLAMTVGLGAVAPSAAHAGVAPKYKVEAVYFDTLRETNEASASDEVFWVFNAVDGVGTSTTRNTPTYDADRGERHNIALQHNCMFGTLSGTGSATRCNGATVGSGVGLSVQAWDQDDESLSSTANKAAAWFKKAGPYVNWIPVIGPWVAKALPFIAKACEWLAGGWHNDQLGTQTWSYSAATLAVRLPAVGRSFTEMKHFSGGGGVNDLTYKVTRVA